MDDSLDIERAVESRAPGLLKGGGFTGYASAFLAGSVWGTTGLFVRFLQGSGMDALSIVLWRTAISSHGLLLFFLLFNRRMLSVERRDIPFVVMTGVFSVVLTQYTFIYAVTHTSLAIAVILNYTAPLFVTLISRVVFGEPITLRKAGALSISAAGLVLILGLYDPPAIGSGSTVAFVVGLASGFFYAVQSLMSKKLVSKYHPLTANAWAMCAGGWALFAVGRLSGTPMTVPASAPARVAMALFAMGPGTLAFYFFLSSLRSIHTSHASIMAMIEPVSAALLGFVFLGEPLAPPQVAGMTAVLVAIVLVSTERQRAEPALDSPAR
ncbi:MAG: EamA family transporter [Firmicutes bacterium]|nr:EamA family transporter [Bacillota bacterium]